MARQVTLTINDTLYAQAQAVAARQDASIEAVLIEAITLDNTTVSEQVARRKANRWLVEHVGNLLMADQGQLVTIHGQIRWRFGVMVTARGKKPHGPFASIDVDPVTAVVLADDTIAQQIKQDGIAFTRPFSSTIS